MFSYYTIIGKDLNLFKGHIDNVKQYAGFDKLECDKELITIVYKNKNIPEEVTSEILEYCDNEEISTFLYEEETDNFLHNLYACWNLGYEKSKGGRVFRGGSDQVFSKDSFIALEKLSRDLDKTILQANTIECLPRLRKIGATSRHIEADFGFNFENFNLEAFEGFVNSMNKSCDKELLTIDECLYRWGKPTGFNCSLGPINRCDGCSWLMTKEQWEEFGPMPEIENGITGDVLIHDRMQQAGYKSLMVRDCVTYHFVQGESTA